MIFLAFANDPGKPLPTLSREEEEVMRLLSQRSSEHHYRLHRDSHATIKSISEYLIRYQKDLEVFHFSGHADRDILLLADQKANSEGIAGLLGACKKLKLVVLNGCSTVGQVEQLLQLPNQPAVIATSAPVNDFTATQFSISFYQALSEQYASLQEAFEVGLSAAKAAASDSLPIAEERGFGRSRAADEAIWLLQTPEGKEERLRYKLPAQTIQTNSIHVEPNQFLLKGLLSSLAAFDSQVKEVMEEKQDSSDFRSRRRLRKGNNQRRNLILKSLPLPISEQIEKLLSKRKDNNQVYYDSFSIDRLRQLLRTYEVAMELPAFFLLAQLFDLLSNEKVKARIEPTQSRVITDFLALPHEVRLRQLFFPLLETGIEIVKQNDVDLFVPEITQITEKEDADFYNAFQGLEIKKENLSKAELLDHDQMIRECIEAEEMLTEILAKLSFLASYSLVSVRNIDVFRNRLFRTPSFVHRVIHLAKKDSNDPEEVEEPLDNFLENESVLLMKKQELSGEIRFLNLTPFIIDENAYVKKAAPIKLHFFHHLHEDDGTYYFKHTYKPDDPLLVLQDVEPEEGAEEGVAILDVWEQFEDFRNCFNP
jgi:hypothetical protein